MKDQFEQRSHLALPDVTADRVTGAVLLLLAAAIEPPAAPLVREWNEWNECVSV